MASLDQHMRERYEARAATKPPKYRSIGTRMPEEEAPKTAACYVVTYIASGGRIYKSRFRGSPKDSWVLEKGKRCAAHYAVRKWPSKKGWRLCDMRNAQCFTEYKGGPAHAKWTDYAWSERIYPNEESAIMHALAILT